MELAVGEKVSLIIEKKTTLGFVVRINEEYEGLLYHNEIYEVLHEGQTTKGYVKKVRDDGKIDVSLQPQGFRNVIDIHSQALFDKIKSNKGFLPLTDSSSPEDIYSALKMSKKAFKKAAGNLYKLQEIRIEPDGLYLNTAQ